MIDPSPQFGGRSSGLDYADRPAAFGLLIRDGLLAMVRITRPGEAAYHDLPGGAVEAGEDEAQAVAREFAEEAGLIVRPQVRLVQASQHFLRSDGTPVNNIGGFWTLELIGEDPDAKVEDDHHLVWLPPDEALRILRHDAHAWAVVTWLRDKVRGNESPA